MAYNWDNMFPQNGSLVSTPGSDMQEKMNRDTLQSRLDQEMLDRRNQYDVQNSQTDFNNQMQILKTSKAYELANMRERAALEAQLIALQKGDLTYKVINQNQPGNPYDAGGLDVTDIFNVANGIGGAMAGYKYRQPIGNAINKGAMNLAEKGSFGTIADDLLQKGSYGLKVGTANVANKINPKVTNPLFKKILQAAETGAVDTSIGMANLGKGLAGKGSTKLASKALGKLGVGAATKVGGALVGGIPGFLASVAISELIDKMITSDDEKERARAEYMMSNFR